jgi:hypothetical protein
VHDERLLSARSDNALDQSAKQAAYAAEEALEEAEHAGQQATDEDEQTAEHTHGAIAPAA